MSFVGVALFLISAAGAEAAAWKIEEMGSPENQKTFGGVSREDLKGLTYVPGEILVKRRDWADEFSIQQMHLRKGAKVVNTFHATHRKERTIQRVRLREGQTVEEALRQYRRNPLVAHAQPNYLYRMQTSPVTPNDPRFDELWGLHNTGQTGGTPDADIDAPEAWEITTGLSDVIIAVIDTGVNYLHPELVGNMWVNTAELTGVAGVDDDGNGFTDDIWGWDFFDNDNDPMDFHGHGTHVAGTIAAQGNNLAGITGVMWDARIMALKISGVKAFAATSDIVAAINYAVEEGAHIINASWGGPGCWTTDASGKSLLRDAIEAAGTAGVLFVAAAGNDGTCNDTTPMFPASYTLPNIIAVAATDPHDNLWTYSNFGATSVDVAAPGVSILSTIPTFSYGTPVPLYNSGGFDADTSGALPAGWVNMGPNNTWAVTDIYSLSSPHSFADNPGVNYINDLISTTTLTYLNDTPITYTKDSRYWLTFDIRYDIASGDWFNIVVSSDDRATWDIYDGFTGSSGGAFASRAFDLTLLIEHFRTAAGIYLGFGIDSDASITDEGVYIDNLLLEREPILINPYDPATNYSFKPGTSMAAPHVAGLAGLLLSRSPYLTVDQLKELIIAGVDPQAGLAGKMVSGGRINAYGSLTIPTVVITSTALDPTNTSPIPMTATFSEDVTGFDITNIAVVNGTPSNFVPVSGSIYTFDVTPDTDGLVSVDIAANVATDAAGNHNIAASTFTITFDSIAPSVTINPVTTPTTIATQTLTGTMKAGATVTLSSLSDTVAFGDITTPTATAWSVVATLAEGLNVITATATDAAGNTGTATAYIIFE
ncbi:S8 family serine peptidase, partial [Thermodesulfovibrionales bacterium]|nr:S8 family serine peptidase [Thermodesulfovibrionales bacterium]